MRPAIVIVTYNRPYSLARLLSSIKTANYRIKDIPLVVSIDGGAENQNEIVKIVENFKWENGTKRVINHAKNLGLKDHVLSCGNLTSEYEAVIVLEDDILVAPDFYTYTINALDFYNSNDRIAQISLYSFNIHIHTLLPFLPLKSKYDSYFMQYPCSWGQCWTKKQWDGFKDWYNLGQQISSNDKLPNHIKKWSESSWLKYFIKYMVENDKLSVYPYYSLTTNLNDAGEHNRSDQNVFQTQIPFKFEDYVFAPLNNDAIIYDVYFEIEALFLRKHSQKLKNFNFDFEVDLYGVKFEDKINSDYFLTTRKSNAPILSFSFILKPIEQNILLDIDSPGKKILLAKRESFVNKTTKIRIWEYFTLPLAFKHSLKQILLRIKQKLLTN